MNKIAVFLVGALICLDSAESQNLIKNNSVRSTQNSPASWCKKSESKGAEVPPVDFLLEAEKRGSPPKSEKAAAFWRVGGAGRGVQPFLREKTSEISGDGVAESIQESQGGWLLRNARKSFGLPRSHSLARNDEILDSSLRATRYAQNDNLMRVAESALDSANYIDSANQSEFIISYRAIMKNNALIGEKFSVAKALSTTPNPHIKATCDIESNALTNALDSNLAILKHNQNAILECFERELSTKIRDDVKSINNEVRTKTTYKIPAQRILLDRQRLKIHIIGQK